MTPKEVADKLGVSAKTLRSFLRRDPKYKSPGSGGAYDLTGFKFSDIEREFNGWRNAITPRAKRSAASAEELISPLLGEDDKPISVRRLKRGTVPDDVKADARKINRDRIARLEAALLSRGLHISQMRDRDGWKKPSKKN
ncbi:MAG: hypothetical protein ACRDSF_00180 [Pseudonocardiaceae bacterium]